MRGVSYEHANTARKMINNTMKNKRFSLCFQEKNLKETQCRIRKGTAYFMTF